MSGNIRSFESLSRAAPDAWAADLIATVYSWSKKSQQQATQRAGSATSPSLAVTQQQSAKDDTAQQLPTWAQVRNRPASLVGIGDDISDASFNTDDGFLSLKNGVWRIEKNPSVYSIESFVDGGSIACDHTNEQWHAPAKDSYGYYGFGWLIPRIGFTKIKFFGSYEQSIGSPGSVSIYGITSGWTNDELITTFEKGLTGTLNMEAWEKTLDLDVSKYEGIGIVMDPAWYQADVDGAHLVKQTGFDISNGVHPMNMTFMVRKDFNEVKQHIITESPLTDTRYLMTHWMKVGVQ